MGSIFGVLGSIGSACNALNGCNIGVFKGASGVILGSTSVYLVYILGSKWVILYKYGL